MKLQISDVSDLSIDLPALLKTRLLIQANSGGGKSYLLRRLAEQMFGKVQVIIIDPEGEFSTLREKFDYVLVGKGGETPADCRSAGLVAHKLLELHASAVCDLYEMKPQERHRWVKLFIDALIDSPKNLWHPVVIIVDEAHVFCPENKAGESEASGAMIDLATRGRKRGFCAIYATQRLGKLKKDAAAELTNVLIGQTFIDIDRDRAADCLGVSGKERHTFDDEIKTIEQGNFYALGRAICTTRTKVLVGKVQTTHPEIGGKKFSSEPPPPSEKVKLMMPKLADLPKAAEDKAKNEAELRGEIRSLKAQLAAAQRAQPEVVKETVKEVPILVDTEVHHIKLAMHNYSDAHRLIIEANEVMTKISGQIALFTDKVGKNKNHWTLPRPVTPLRPPPIKPHVPTQMPTRPAPVTATINGDFKINRKQQDILNALAWWESVGINQPSNLQVGAIALIDSTGGHFSNTVGPLSTNGLVVRGNGITYLTDEGRKVAQMPDNIATMDDYHEMLRQRVRRARSAGGKTIDILNVLISHGGEEVTTEQIGQEAQIDHTGGHFSNMIGPLSTLGLIDRRAGVVRPTEILFPKGIQ